MSDALFISVTVAVTIWGLFMWLFKGEWSRNGKLKRRALSFSSSYNNDTNNRTKKQAPRPEQSIQIALKELEAQKRNSSSKSLRIRMRQAGLQGNPVWFLMRMIVIDIAVIGFLYWAGLTSAFIAMAGVIILYALTFGRLNFLRRRRIAQITSELPVALDVVYRAIRAGLPLVEALKLGANETAQPLQGELKRILHDLAVGLSLEEAVQRFATRVPTNDASFFATVINIQTTTGGNISTAIGNLLVTMREREQLVSRVKTVTSEVTTSAKIIGALPILAVIALMLISPGIIDVLFRTPRGNQILGGSAIWMSIGIFVMRNMTRIKV